MSENTRDLGKVIEIDEARIKDHLGEIVRGTVEETLKAMLDAEADRICNAKRSERSPDRKDTRAGHYTRKLGTRAGEARTTRNFENVDEPPRCFQYTPSTWLHRRACHDAVPAQ